MFRPQKSSAERGAETIDFRFLQFRATNVPNGWDKLIVNIISMETGKAIAKTNKALVHKGSCQWSEDVSESVCFLQDDNSSELEDKLYKFVVSMGSARSGILGEATINLADYLNSRLLVRIPLPLKRCNHGTILHVKLQCLTPREGPRDSGWRTTALDQAEYISVSEEVDDGSEGSDNYTAGKIGPSSSHHFSALQQVQSATKQAHGSISPRKLQKLIRLQKQNFALAQQEHEFMSKLAAQELFQKEVQRLQEVNEQLQIDLTRFKETVKRGDILDRVVTLETELAEALESNSMYKSQLRRFLRDEENVQAAALQNFGTIDQVINDLVSYKRKASILEEDLNDMRKRYSNLSLQLAEVEAQREELVMTLKNAKYGTRRSG